MFSAFVGAFAGASLALHPGALQILVWLGAAWAIFWLALCAFMVLGCAVYYAWRFVISPALLCGMAVIGAPFYVIFILAPWCLRRLFRTTLAADDPLWHPFQRSEFDAMSRAKRVEWAARYGRDA